MARHRWTPKAAVARSRRQINAAIDNLRDVALEWEDVDQSYVSGAEDLIHQLDAFAERIDKEVQQRLAAGEHIGI